MEGFFFKSTKLVGTGIRGSLEKQELNNNGLFDRWSGDQWGVCGRMVGVVNGQPKHKEKKALGLGLVPCK